MTVGWRLDSRGLGSSPVANGTVFLGVGVTRAIHEADGRDSGQYTKEEKGKEKEEKKGKGQKKRLDNEPEVKEPTTLHCFNHTSRSRGIDARGLGPALPYAERNLVRAQANAFIVICRLVISARHILPMTLYNCLAPSLASSLCQLCQSLALFLCRRSAVRKAGRWRRRRCRGPVSSFLFFFIKVPARSIAAFAVAT